MIRRVVTHLAMALLLCCFLSARSASASETPVATTPPPEAVAPEAVAAEAPAAVPALTPTDLATHVVPLPSAALAGVALLSITAAHSFGRRRRQG